MCYNNDMLIVRGTTKRLMVNIYLIAITCTLLILHTKTHSFALDNSRVESLSEINYDKDEISFLSNIPWSEKDPFVFPVSTVESPKNNSAYEVELIELPTPPKVELNAILYSEKSSSAIIDGKVLKVGSIVNKQKILKIEKDFVKLDFNGQQYKVELKDFTIESETK